MRVEPIAPAAETNQIQLRADLVKKFSTASIDRSLFMGKGAVSTIVINKPKKKSGNTPYFFKPYYKNGNAHPYLATIEAVGAHLLQLVFSPHFTPKVRVVHDAKFQGRPIVISKVIPGFRPASRLSVYEMIEFANTKQRDFARLSLIVFCFKNPDLHIQNWGVDVNQCIVEFDQDQLFCNFTHGFQGDASQLGDETEDYVLSKWPELIYDLSDAFGVVSADDVLNMPIFEDLKTYNHPLRRSCGPFVNDPWYFISKQLQKDDVFIQWKFFYLTKYLILLSHERIETTIKSHSPASPGNDHFNAAFLRHIENRHKQIQDVLFHMPHNEYQTFLNKVFPSLEKELENEMLAYNQLFCDREGELKGHKAHHVVSAAWIKEALKRLKEEASLAVKENTIENQKKRRMELQVTRITREINVIQKINAVLLQPTPDHNVQSLKARLRDAVECINNHIALLLKNDGDLFTATQFTVIWNLIPHNCQTTRYVLIANTIEFAFYEKISESAIEWLVSGTQTVAYNDPNQNLNTQRFLDFFSVLKAMASNDARYQPDWRHRVALTIFPKGAEAQVSWASAARNAEKQLVKKIMSLVCARDIVMFSGVDLGSFLTIAKRKLSRHIAFPDLIVIPETEYAVRLRFENAQFTLSSVALQPLESPVETVSLSAAT
ncbi:MAG: hypothetical protein NTZ67_06810 [Gammaproteobacteria bacterium]|nr:hypothetical protein [Gammaproteobacteria bacterium]